jgi:hypothetical protein
MSGKGVLEAVLPPTLSTENSKLQQPPRTIDDNKTKSGHDRGGKPSKAKPSARVEKPDQEFTDTPKLADPVDPKEKNEALGHKALPDALTEGPASVAAPLQPPWKVSVEHTAHVAQPTFLANVDDRCATLTTELESLDFGSFIWDFNDDESRDAEKALSTNKNVHQKRPLLHDEGEAERERKAARSNTQEPNNAEATARIAALLAALPENVSKV